MRSSVVLPTLILIVAAFAYWTVSRRRAVRPADDIVPGGAGCGARLLGLDVAGSSAARIRGFKAMPCGTC